MASRRLLLLGGLFALGFAALLGRLADLQILRGEDLRRRADDRKSWREVIPAIRGRILADGGEVLAEDAPAYDVLAIPDEVEDPARLAAFLGVPLADLERRLLEGKAAVLRDLERRLVDGKAPDLGDRQIGALYRILSEEDGRTPGGLAAAIRRARREPQPVLLDAPREQILRIRARAEAFPELAIADRSVRRYPQGTTAAHLVGSVGPITIEQIRRWTGVDVATDGGYAQAARALRETGLDLGDLAGQSGIEALCEEGLRGMRGIRVHEKDHRGAQVQTLLEQPPVAGRDVRLTIRLPVQRAAEAALAGRRGAVVAMDCRTGAILALASAPAPDPNRPETALGEGSPAVSRAIRGLYPPGSVMKVVTAVAGLESRAVDPRTAFDCQQIYPGSTRFRCLGLHGEIALGEALQKSCNIYFCFTADRIHAIDPQALPRTAERFGFGAPSGLDLPGEARGQVPRTQNPGDARNLAIGQGALLVTPIQVVRMIAAIGNGGTLPTPHVLPASALPGRPLEGVSRATLAEIRRDLARVVLEERGTAHAAYREVDPGVPAAGKTGTAEAPGGDHAWFAGYAPAERPEIAFVILWEHANLHGAEAARAAFRVVRAWREDQGSRR